MSLKNEANGLRRGAVMAYSGFCYLLFLLTFTYLVFFLGDLWGPSQISGPASELGLIPALAINLLLVAAFGVQHSVMARRSFKDKITKIIPKAAERATFVLATNVVLIATYLFWQPIPATIWQVDTPILRTILWVLFFSGWGIVLLSSFLINHFQLFGLEQAFNHLKERISVDSEFKTPWLYRLVRHPMMTGMVIALWAAPDMSVSKLIFVIGMTVYIAIGVYYEEKDLVKDFGESYRSYQKEVPSVVPGFRLKAKGTGLSEEPGQAIG